MHMHTNIYIHTSRKISQTNIYKSTHACVRALLYIQINTHIH